MYERLREFMIELATDPRPLSDFIAAPRTAAEKAGLSPEEVDILVSGDQVRIFCAFKGIDVPQAPPPPAEQQQAAAQGWYAWPQQWGAAWPQQAYGLTAWPGLPGVPPQQQTR